MLLGRSDLGLRSDVIAKAPLNLALGLYPNSSLDRSLDFSHHQFAILVGSSGHTESHKKYKYVVKESNVMP